MKIPVIVWEDANRIVVSDYISLGKMKVTEPLELTNKGGTLYAVYTICN